MKALKITEEQEIEIIEIEDKLEELQQQVKGYIEIHSLYRFTGENLCFVCNEEGILKQLKPSCITPYGPILGPCLFLREEGPDLISLEQNDQDYIVKMLDVWAIQWLEQFKDNFPNLKK